MLMPKRVKFRRMQRGRMTGKATRGNTVSYGEYGLMALEPGWVKSNQIDAIFNQRMSGAFLFSRRDRFECI